MFRKRQSSWSSRNATQSVRPRISPAGRRTHRSGTSHCGNGEPCGFNACFWRIASIRSQFRSSSRSPASFMSIQVALHKLASVTMTPPTSCSAWPAGREYT